MYVLKHIGPSPTNAMYQSGLEIDYQCARCGSSMMTERCEHCEDGYDGHDCGEDCCACLCPDENVRCQYCDGTGVWHHCVSSAEYCQAHPLPGRASIKRGEIEWFVIVRKAVEEGAK